MIEIEFLKMRQRSILLRSQSVESRRDHLETLDKALRQYTEHIVQALAADFAKPEAEVLMTELYPLLHEIKYVRKNLKKWMRPQSAGASIMLAGTSSQVLYEPRGVCLIISPWNYPLQLALAPLIASIAAGNCSVIKPSELTPRTSAVLKKMISEHFSADFIKVIEGDSNTTQQLLQHPFDHIFFTGSTRVGKIIMEAASRHLSTVTLELGGKSPVIVDASADIEIAAEKIAWGKFINAGQTCIAPDYVLVHESQMEALKQALGKKIKQFYGVSDLDKKQSKDFARIVSRPHAERLGKMLTEAVTAKAEIVSGGEVDLEQNYISPTVLANVPVEISLMKEEIFGPLLPLLPFKDLQEAVHFINERPKPLALYLFAQNATVIEQVAKEISAGGMCINDTVIHVANAHLPFGGVGESGMGHYHGYHGFKNFSHSKSILRRNWLFNFMRIAYPPYTLDKLKMLKFIIRWRL